MAAYRFFEVLLFICFKERQFMLPLIADSAAFFLLMLPLIADSAALWLQKARQPKG